MGKFFLLVDGISKIFYENIFIKISDDVVKYEI